MVLPDLPLLCGLSYAAMPHFLKRCSQLQVVWMSFKKEIKKHCDSPAAGWNKAFVLVEWKLLIWLKLAPNKCARNINIKWGSEGVALLPFFPPSIVCFQEKVMTQEKRLRKVQDIISWYKWQGPSYRKAHALPSRSLCGSWNNKTC